MARKRTYKKSFKIKRKKSLTSFLKKRSFWGFLLCFLAISVSFYFLIFHDFFWVKDISVLGIDKTDIYWQSQTESLDLVIENNIEKKIFSFNSFSMLLVDSKKLQLNLLDNFLAIDNVFISKKLPNLLTIDIVEKEPIALWCQEIDSLVCFDIDKNGVIFINESKRKQGPVIYSLDKTLPVLGESIIDKEGMENLLAISNNLDIPIKKIMPISFSRANVETAEGWQIYFDLRKDISFQIASLGVVLDKTISPERRKTLEYIDLRFSRIYFK